MEYSFMDLNNKSAKSATSTGEPVAGQAPTSATTSETPTPGTSETPAEIGTDTSEAPAEIISTTPATTPAPAASETPVPTSAPALSEAPATAASEAPTPAPANADQPDTAVDVRRQRVEELKKSLTSGSGSVATPTPGATKATPATSKTSPATASPGTLPADYLTGGYRKGEGKESYPNPALIDHAEKIGEALAAGGVTPTAFNRMVRALKGAAKLPYDAQQGALKKLIPLALKEKKTSHLLREVVERNRVAVQNEADFAACLDHFQDIAIFLAANVIKK